MDTYYTELAIEKTEKAAIELRRAIGYFNKAKDCEQEIIQFKRLLRSIDNRKRDIIDRLSPT